MASRPQDWIVAAACCEGPRQCVTFADLPPQHRRDMVLVAFAAALSTAYFVTLGILMQPIPSRSLAAQIVMPKPVVIHAAVVDPEPGLPIDMPSRHPARPRAPRPVSAIQLASVSVPSGDTRIGSAAAPREHRPNFLGRFFRSVLRTGRPKAATASP
jgi:hypothetical protein